MVKSVLEKTHLPQTKKIVCAFCKGVGKDPFGQLYPGSRCQVCNGLKVIYVHTPYKKCVYCHGSGVEFSSQNTCTACLGRGIISLGKKGKKKINFCPRCQGSGMDIESNLPCSKCRGQGKVMSV